MHATDEGSARRPRFQSVVVVGWKRAPCHLYVLNPSPPKSEQALPDEGAGVDES